jgi:hypothetical protein
MTRVAWFRLILGLVLGLIFGLYYAWFVSPRQIHQSSPQDLSPNFQDEYRTLVASSFASTGNISHALSRLELLSDPQSAASLNDLAQSHLAAGRADKEVRALAQLASAIEPGASSGNLTQTSTPEATAEIPSPTPPPPASTLPPTASPSPMPAYRLLSTEKVCDLNLVSALIQVVVLDSRGEGVPGVEVLIIWDQGEDHFFTGMKPELGLGYGDFTMDVDVTYTLQLANALEGVTNIHSEECAMVEGGIFSGSVLLRFEEP